MSKTKCDVCLSPNIIFTKRAQIRGWPFIWKCNDCFASVGCHPDSDKPLGLMASRYTRELRIKAHAWFDKIYLCGFMSRARAVRWAKAQIGFTEEFHISSLSNFYLEELIKYAKQYLEKKGFHKLSELRSKENERKYRDLNKEKEHNARQAKRRKKRA
jgi:hypothetical protein